MKKKFLKSCLRVDTLKHDIPSNSKLNTLCQTTKKLVWGLLLLSPFALTGCMVRLSTPTGVADSSDANQAKFYIQAIAKGQQAYYLTHGELAGSIDRLSIGLNLENESYRYQLTKGEQDKSVVMTAAAKTPELPSYTGVVYLNQDTSGVSAIANVCQTEKPSTEPPKIQITLNPGASSLECPSGSRSVQ